MSEKENDTTVKTWHDKMHIFGRIICKYKMEIDLIDDLNHKYEDALKKTNLLTSHGKNLAGRLDSELDVLPILQSCKIFKKISNRVSKRTTTGPLKRRVIYIRGVKNCSVFFKTNMIT